MLLWWLHFTEELIAEIKNDIEIAKKRLSNVPLSPDQLNFFAKQQQWNIIYSAKLQIV